MILPSSFDSSGITDSKALNEKSKQKAKERILKDSIAYSIAEVSAFEIDKNGIQASNEEVFFQCLLKIQASGISIRNCKVIIDGSWIPSSLFSLCPDITCIVKGDSKFAQIASASILAKTYRDHLMIQLSKEFPEFDWDCNSGYASKKHREAIISHGITPHHRRYFLNNLSSKYTLKEYSKLP